MNWELSAKPSESIRSPSARFSLLTRDSTSRLHIYLLALPLADRACQRTYVLLHTARKSSISSYLSLRASYPAIHSILSGQLSRYCARRSAESVFLVSALKPAPTIFERARLCSS